MFGWTKQHKQQTANSKQQTESFGFVGYHCSCRAQGAIISSEGPVYYVLCVLIIQYVYNTTVLFEVAGGWAVIDSDSASATTSTSGGGASTISINIISIPIYMYVYM